MTEPAIDLGICLAIVSSAKDIVIPDNVMVFGEVGLSGEIRAVNIAGQRVQEAKKLGFGTVVLPEVCRSSVGKVEGINLVYVSQIRDAIGYIMKNRLSDYWLIYGLNKSIRLSSKIFLPEKVC